MAAWRPSAYARPCPPPAPGTRPPRSETEALDQLDKVLEDSVRVHQRSDVPYGLFLSGGIDSAAIAAMMSRLNERPVTAYTCGFVSGPGYPPARDERGQAEKVARALNLDWREVSFGEEDFWRVLPAVASALDDPTADYAILPTYKLAEAAKGTLTVVLTGEGGDELFAGYGRYRRALRPGWLGGRPAGPKADTLFLRDRGADAVTRWRLATEPPDGPGPPAADAIPRHRRLAAGRSAAQARPLFDGPRAWRAARRSSIRRWRASPFICRSP